MHASLLDVCTRLKIRIFDSVGDQHVLFLQSLAFVFDHGYTGTHLGEQQTIAKNALAV